MEQQLGDAAVWQDPDRARTLGHEKSQLTKTVEGLDSLSSSLTEAVELLELAAAEAEAEVIAQIAEDVGVLESQLALLEWQRMFSGEADDCDAFLTVQAGSGGTEAQDWAEMLFRMYLRWVERRGFAAEVVEATPGEVAGLKSACVKVIGDHAFGWLRTESGVHRLVRKSPFDSGNRRHTSFASVLVSPEVDEDIGVAVDMAEVRVDTYRASGAGGQHVNKTDSAVRLTHLPSGIVTQCQSERSQHKNKDKALKQMQSRLYELERQKQREQKARLEGEKADIGWGSQIRSYVLDQSRIKDLRTGEENSDTRSVLDGDLDGFIEASLKAGL